MKPIIGIIATPDETEKNDCILAVGEYYRLAVLKAGGIPIMILPTQNILYQKETPEQTKELSKEELMNYFEALDKCDGIIIPGGNRIFEYHRLACRFAIQKNIPIIGICMGMQTMATVDNESLCIEKNETELDHHQRNVPRVHKVKLENGKLKEMLKTDSFEVNSVHNYHITKVNNFVVEAYSSDGLIEAISLPNKKFVMGFQWHPEKIYETEASQKIFQTFIEKCKDKIKAV